MSGAARSRSRNPWGNRDRERGGRDPGIARRRRERRRLRERQTGKRRNGSLHRQVGQRWRGRRFDRDADRTATGRAGGATGGSAGTRAGAGAPLPPRWSRAMRRGRRAPRPTPGRRRAHRPTLGRQRSRRRARRPPAASARPHELRLASGCALRPRPTRREPAIGPARWPLPATRLSGPAASSCRRAPRPIRPAASCPAAWPVRPS